LGVESVLRFSHPFEFNESSAIVPVTPDMVMIGVHRVYSGTFRLISKARVLTSHGYGELCAEKTVKIFGARMYIGLVSVEFKGPCIQVNEKYVPNPIVTLIFGGS
jgi:hypothetical protein